MEKIILEIRIAEGGDDAKLLIQDLAHIYQRACQQENFICETTE